MVEINDDGWRKRSLGFLCIPAELGRTESSHFSFLCAWHVSECLWPMSILWKHLKSWRIIYQGLYLKSSWILKPSIRCTCNFSKIMLNAVSVMGCAIVETAGLSKAMEWILWQSHAITSMQVELEKLEWMHRPGEAQGLIGTWHWLSWGCGWRKHQPKHCSSSSGQNCASFPLHLNPKTYKITHSFW